MAKITFIIAVISLFFGGILLFLDSDKNFAVWFLSVGIGAMTISIIHRLTDLEEFEKKYPYIYVPIHAIFIVFFGILLPEILRLFL